MVKYCRADVELLSKAVLSFRKMFKEGLDIDAVRYATLAILCMAISRGCFLPDKSSVANEQPIKVSKECREWLFYLRDDSPIPEVPIFINKSQFKCGELEFEYYPRDRHIFTVDAVCKKKQ